MKQPVTWGVSFSKKYCQELGLDWRETLKAILEELPVKRLRLMSYWDLLEPTPGKYDFKDLDWQFEQALKHQARVSLSLGMRQPRWPECHLPQWAQDLTPPDRNAALMNYLQAVVKRYRKHSALLSWQLENEALNRSFGLCPDFDRQRLREEFQLVKKLDPNHKIIMTTSNSWGLPFRRPLPDIVGFSYYWVQHRGGKYHRRVLPPLAHAARSAASRLMGRPAIIHELQAEPWGPAATAGLSAGEQARTMDARLLKAQISRARRTGIKHIDLWGAEWWYWRKVQGDDSLWQTIKELKS